jgi:hypothetical protein
MCSSRGQTHSQSCCVLDRKDVGGVGERGRPRDVRLFICFSPNRYLRSCVAAFGVIVQKISSYYLPLLRSRTDCNLAAFPRPSLVLVSTMNTNATTCCMPVPPSREKRRTLGLVRRALQWQPRRNPIQGYRTKSPVKHSLPFRMVGRRV